MTAAGTCRARNRFIICLNETSCENKKRLSAADPLLFFVDARSNNEKVVIKKLLNEDDQEKRLFIKEARVNISRKKLLFYPFLGGEEGGGNFCQICGF